MLGVTAWLHLDIFQRVILGIHKPLTFNLIYLFIFTPAIYTLIVATQRLATRLTVWEAAYCGFRLPHAVVLRALYYHSAHTLPVALLVMLTVAAYSWLQSGAYLQITSAPAYLYVLSGEVIVASVYLFATYWIAMRNLMYANR